MKEQILQKLIDYLQKTEDFMLSECPMVIQEALKYHYISSLVGMISCFFLACLSCYVFYYFYTNPTFDKYESRELSCMMPLFFSGPIAFMSFLGMCVNVDTFIKISVAPKYFLISLFLK